jgi:hypothetical protein
MPRFAGSNPDPRRRAAVGALVLAFALAACAGGAPEVEEPEPEPLTGWRVGVADHIALWYHGLAITLASTQAADTTSPVPSFDAGYVAEVAAAKRRRGVYPTPLDQRAEEFGAIFRGDEAYRGLEFVPLYFRSANALFSAIDLWNRAEGNPNRAGSAEGARVVAFLSSLFRRPAQRRAVVEWAGLLREEATAFHDAYWQEQLPGLQARGAAVQRAWDAIAPRLADYLDIMQLERGELFLVPALGAEGRLVTRGVASPRAAILVPPEGRPSTALWAFAHELVYPITGEAIRDYVAPARIRELGEQRLASIAAVRGGAILLERTAPDEADGYRRFYLTAAGREAPDGGESLEAAFEAAFPLPPELAEGLEDAIEQALAGI